MIKVNCYNVNYDSIDHFALMEWEAGRMTNKRAFPITGIWSQARLMRASEFILTQIWNSTS